MVWLQTRCILDDVVAGRVHSSLPNRLRDQEEVVPLRLRHNVINYSSTRWIGWLSCHLEEPGVNSLTDDDVGEQQLIICETRGSEAVLNCRNLMLHHVWNLTIAYTIPKNLR